MAYFHVQTVGFGEGRGHQHSQDTNHWSHNVISFKEEQSFVDPFSKLSCLGSLSVIGVEWLEYYIFHLAIFHIMSFLVFIKFQTSQSWLLDELVGHCLSDGNKRLEIPPWSMLARKNIHETICKVSNNSSLQAVPNPLKCFEHGLDLLIWFPFASILSTDYVVILYIPGIPGGSNHFYHKTPPPLHQMCDRVDQLPLFPYNRG